MEVISKCHPRVLIWNLSLKLDGAPLPLDSSIRDFQKEKAGYVANALEQPLLLALVCPTIYFMYYTHIYILYFWTISHIITIFQAIQTTNIVME